MHYSTLGGILSTLAFSSLASAQTICNNSPLLCNRAYDNVTHLGAHDSAFQANVTNDYNIAANQYYNSIEQLNAGVRLLTAQIHRANDSNSPSAPLHLCHTLCEVFDAGSMLDWLKGIDKWLDHNKNEVVTLLFVNAANATTAELAELYRDSEVDEHSYVPSSQSTPIKNWPTLQQMISSNKRVVNWIAPLNGNNNEAPYLLDEFSSVFENSYNNNAVTDYSCQPDRPASLQNNAVAAQQSGRLFLMNHFLYRSITSTIQVPNRVALNTTNSIDPNTQGSVAQHAQQCSAQYNRAPNYVLVDFFNTASPIHVVDELNDVSCCVFGRANVDNGNCGIDGYLCYAQVSDTNSTSSTTGTTGGNSSSPSATTSTNAVSASQTASGGASGRLTTRASATYAGLAAVFFAALML